MLAIILLVLLGAICLLPPATVEANKQLQVVQTVLPYHRVMSPKWINSNAVITGPHALYPQYFEFLSTNGAMNRRILRTQLVAPNILTSTDSVTVAVTVAVDVSYASNNDHNPIIGVSDGKSFISFAVPDRSFDGCAYLEADSSKKVLRQVHFNSTYSGPSVISQRYSSEIKMQFKPAEQWGSCHTEHDEGFTSTANYQRLLDPSKGLFFEIYRHNPSEKYRIKYIMIDADFD